MRIHLRNCILKHIFLCNIVVFQRHAIKSMEQKYLILAWSKIKSFTELCHQVKRCHPLCIKDITQQYTAHFVIFLLMAVLCTQTTQRRNQKCLLNYLTNVVKGFPDSSNKCFISLRNQRHQHFRQTMQGIEWNFLVGTENQALGHALTISVLKVQTR